MKTRLALAAAVLVTAACGDSPTAPQTPAPPAPSAVSLVSVSIVPSPMAGGASGQGTVTLSAAAPVGGTAVSLSSSSGAATLPSATSIPAGATSGTFAFKTTAVSEHTDVTITASAGGVSRTAMLRLMAEGPAPGPAAPLVGLTSRHDDIVGGENSTGTITLEASAPAGGMRVGLASDDAAVTVPSWVTIAAGDVSASFKIDTAVVIAARDVRITATFAGPALEGAAATLSMVVRVVPQSAVPAPPTAAADSYTASEDTALTVAAAQGVLANDFDVNLDPLTAVVVSGTANGTLTLNASGSFTYTPHANFNGSDSFVYRANDGSANSNTATVSITITAVNDAPVAGADNYSVDEDGTLTVPVATGVLANDTDADGQSLTVTLVSSTTNGMLAIIPDGSFTYTPAAGFNGTDSFRYRATDGTADSAIVTVTITVGGVNDAPVAVNDSYTVSEDTPLAPDAASGLLANDTDGDGDTLTAALVTGPARGTLTLNANGSFIYTPNANVNGSDSFAYRASDGTANSNSATVSITITAVNDAPVAVANSYTTNEDTVLAPGASSGVVANDTDADGTPLAASVVAGPANGSLTLNADGSFTYTPNANFNGSDSFTYRASDGLAQSAPAAVTLTVAPVNDAPVVSAGTFSANEGVTCLVITMPVSDVDGDELTFQLTTEPVNGELFHYGSPTDPVGAKVTPSTGPFIQPTLCYRPIKHFFHGTDAFTYTVTDGTATVGPATIGILIINTLAVSAVSR